MSTTATTETPVTFSREIANLLHAAGGNPVSSCMQCGTCSGTCPVGDFMDVRPQRLIRMIDAGMKDQVMATRSFWYCASCYQCTVRCPRGIDIAELMYGLKRFTIWRSKYPEDLIGPTFSETFVKNIVRTGRSYEPVLATSYFFTLGLKEMLQEATGATMLMLKGRLPVLPARIKRLENFKRMIKRIIPIGD